MRSIFPTRSRALAAVAAALVIATTVDAAPTAQAQVPTFDDVHARAVEFIEYSHTVALTKEQEQTKREALGAIPAPCCADYSIATCCCPCNLAKSVWGLAKYAIARLGYDVPRTRALVVDWLKATNPKGYSGDSCFRGGCPKPFAANGCGGMKEDALVF
jgi:hypothetical protein